MSKRLPKLPKFPAPPNPVTVVKNILTTYSIAMSGAPVSIFDEKDFAGACILFGDSNEDKRVDVRMVVLGRGAKGLQPLMTVGPENVPVREALDVGHRMAELLPAQFQGAVKTGIGAAAGASGMLEKALLNNAA